MSNGTSPPAVNPQDPLLASAARLIALRIHGLLDYEQHLWHADRVAELHEMRIAAKRLRYTLELFLPAFQDYSDCGAEIARAIDEVKWLQERLGRIHDADVLVPRLARHLGGMLTPPGGGGAEAEGVHWLDVDACQGILVLCREVRDERDRHYAALLERWQRLQEEAFFERLQGLLRRVLTGALAPRAPAASQ